MSIPRRCGSYSLPAHHPPYQVLKEPARPHGATLGRTSRHIPGSMRGRPGTSSTRGSRLLLYRQQAREPDDDYTGLSSLGDVLGHLPAPRSCAPRLHDLRHSFAVATLLRWYRSGVNPADRLIHLSTFLGHVHPSSTAVYLTITAELLGEASGRFERFAAPVLFEGDAP